MTLDMERRTSLTKLMFFIEFPTQISLSKKQVLFFPSTLLAGEEIILRIFTLW